MANNEKDVTDRAEIEALFAKLHWLGKHINMKRVKKVCFKKFSYNLLQTESGYDHKTTFGGGMAFLLPYLKRDIFLFTHKGVFLGQVGKKRKFVSRRRWLFWTIETEDEVLFQETVGEAVERIIGAWETFFFIGFVPEENNDNIKSTLIITHLPADLQLSQAIHLEKEAARQKMDKRFGTLLKQPS